ncbi:unnamed protein product [Enterobius vermicularis]|uniref:Uncharacterized protein n=1 Tax=Enterobius vermicularis TaxID=51028 RepID=A0A0N4VA31_ENTVE|nr:unnamed protein product [Enterobius vermicularis]
MRLGVALWRNLNLREWNRKVWEIGYRGPPLPKLKQTGRPPGVVTDDAIRLLQERFQREYEVMRCLATPYLTKEREAPYLAAYGDFNQQLQNAKQEQEYRSMPGEPKKVTGYKRIDRRYANVGNLLHVDRTIEDSLKHIIEGQRWD